MILGSSKASLPQVSQAGLYLKYLKFIFLPRSEKVSGVQVLVLVGVFTFCWGPYALLAMAGILGLSSHIPVLVTVLPLQVTPGTWDMSIIVYLVSISYQSSSADGQKLHSLEPRHLHPHEPPGVEII